MSLLSYAYGNDLEGVSLVKKRVKNIASDKAFEWSTDYKPMDESLSYREYVSHGYSQGYLQALKDLNIL